MGLRRPRQPRPGRPEGPDAADGRQGARGWRVRGGGVRRPRRVHARAGRLQGRAVSKGAGAGGAAHAGGRRVGQSLLLRHVPQGQLRKPGDEDRRLRRAIRRAHALRRRPRRRAQPPARRSRRNLSVCMLASRRVRHDGGEGARGGVWSHPLERPRRRRAAVGVGLRLERWALRGRALPQSRGREPPSGGGHTQVLHDGPAPRRLRAAAVLAARPLARRRARHRRRHRP